MSIFASREQKTIPIPFDLPNEVTIQKLSWKKLERASNTFVGQMMAEVQERGGSRVYKDMQELWKKPEQPEAPKNPDAPDVATEIEKVKNDPLNGYDKYELLRCGIVAWSYDVSLKPVTVTEKDDDGHAVTRITHPAIDDLSDEAVEFFATEIMRLTKPSLFLTVEEKKEAQVKG